jgi:ubiquinone/menaquinone biosynthesis C-methylase UbiE
VSDTAEFDQFAETYEAVHRDNIRLSGEDPDYFARYKIEAVARLWAKDGLVSPKAILDFGTGVGNALPHLAEHFTTAKITGVDVSPGSLEVAERRFPGVADLILYDGQTLPFETGSQDLVFSSCVFHHIDAAAHVALLAELKRVLAPDGRLVIFEHNPINPVTRYIVATCPFDADAVLIPAGRFKARQREAGLRQVRAVFTGFFPNALRGLRPLEGLLARLPLGAQYYTVARG